MTFPESIKDYYLSDKVFACAEAERAAGTTARSLVWLSPDTLVVNPPVLYALDDATDAAIRPVHIRNVGIPVDEPLDPFWTGVFRCAGLDDTTYSVESFVDGQRVRAYCHSHSYCVNPSVGLSEDGCSVTRLSSLTPNSKIRRVRTSSTRYSFIRPCLAR